MKLHAQRQCQQVSKNLMSFPNLTGTMNGTGKDIYIPYALQSPNPTPPVTLSCTLTTNYPASNQFTSTKGDEIAFSQFLSQSDWVPTYFDGTHTVEYYTAKITSSQLKTETIGSISFPHNAYSGSFTQTTAVIELTLDHTLTYTGI